MKLEKKHWIIIGVVVAIIVIWYFFLRKDSKAIAFIPGKGPGESSYREESGHGGGGHGGGGHGGWGGGRGWGGRGWDWGGGWGWGWPYNEPIVINSTRCPEGWVWMGTVVGCVKP